MKLLVVRLVTGVRLFAVEVLFEPLKMVDGWYKPSTDNVEESNNRHVYPKIQICGIVGVKNQQSNEDKEEAASSLLL